jgi:hypothetical protein
LRRGRGARGAGVVARLDKGAFCGLWTWNSQRATRRKVWDEAAGEFKSATTTRLREQWLFVPVPDAGVPREVVEAGRASRTTPQAIGGRQTLLDALQRNPALRRVRAYLEPQHRLHEEWRRFHYYSCRSRHNTGPSRDCGDRKYLRAEQIEEQGWEFVRGLLREPERIRAGLDRLIEEERTNAERDPEF